MTTTAGTPRAHHGEEMQPAAEVQTDLTHLEQYKMLREEIMQNIRVMDNVQYVAAIGAGAIFTWLVLNKGLVSWKFLWFVPPALVVFCSLKYLDLTNRIWQIAAYLARIEEVAFSQDARLPGWERYKKIHKLRAYDKVLFAATALGWLILIIGSFALSVSLYNGTQQGIPANVPSAAAQHGQSPDDPVLGTWKLNVEKSKFVPGPGWQSQIRVYQITPAGVLVTWTGLDAKGEKMQVRYTYKYDGRDYPMAGSGSYDTLNAVRIDALTVKSEEKRKGKTVGIAVRTVSPDGKVLTITDEGTNRKGLAFSQVLVFDRQ
jgi:hypothetical protein